MSMVARRYWPRGGGGGRGGGTPYNGLYVEAPPERGTLFRLEVIKRVGISRAEVRKGKLTFRCQKGLSKYLEQTHLTADS